MSHARDFGLESGNSQLAEQLVFDYREADLPLEDRLLCDYAVKLTKMPGQVTRSDVQRLQDAGFSDAQITVAAQVISYFNYINRIADGLGVEPEAWMANSDDWYQRKAHDY